MRAGASRHTMSWSTTRQVPLSVPKRSPASVLGTIVQVPSPAISMQRTTPARVDVHTPTMSAGTVVAVTPA